jgi:hypothetical protein
LSLQGDAGSVVANLQHHLAVRSSDTDVDLPPRGGVAHGILQEVTKEKSQLLFVTRDGDVGLDSLSHFHLFGGGQRFDRL